MKKKDFASLTEGKYDVSQRLHEQIVRLGILLLIRNLTNCPLSRRRI